MYTLFRTALGFKEVLSRLHVMTQVVSLDNVFLNLYFLTRENSCLPLPSTKNG